MANYKCDVCGFVYDEAVEGTAFASLPPDWECPICRASVSRFREVSSVVSHGETVQKEISLDYPKEFKRSQDPYDRHMEDIHEMAVTGRTIIEAMNTTLPVTGWDDILLLGAQLDPMPLDEDAPVNIRTVIGRNAAKPLVLESPVYISHMSFGALSKEVKLALAKGSAAAKTAMCSGEGGILPEEMQSSWRYIFEYVPNVYSVTTENLRAADAIEIKIGQGTKPGMGGHLPGEKVTEEIARIRGKAVNEDIISPLPL